MAAADVVCPTVRAACAAGVVGVMEAEYAIDDTNKLSLFDCLIPKLKENRRFKIKKDDVFSIADFKTQQRVK